MKAKTLKELIVVVIALLIISEIFSWLYEVIQSTYGLIIAVVVFAVYTYFGIKAREKASTTTLFLMPALLCSIDWNSCIQFFYRRNIFNFFNYTKFAFHY